MSAMLGKQNYMDYCAVSLGGYKYAPLPYHQMV